MPLKFSRKIQYLVIHNGFIVIECCRMNFQFHDISLRYHTCTTLMRNCLPITEMHLCRTSNQVLWLSQHHGSAVHAQRASNGKMGGPRQMAPGFRGHKDSLENTCSYLLLRMARGQKRTDHSFHTSLPFSHTSQRFFTSRTGLTP